MSLFVCFSHFTHDQATEGAWVYVNININILCRVPSLAAKLEWITFCLVTACIGIPIEKKGLSFEQVYRLE